MIDGIAILFGAILIAVGAAGFVVPSHKALTSGAPAYNAFHIGFGIAGIVLSLAGDAPARIFVIGFGLIDLYQFAASFRSWFPKRLFRWTRVDDALHLIVGAALVVAGIAV